MGEGDSVNARGLHPVLLHGDLRAQGWSAMLTQLAADRFHPSDRGPGFWAQASWRVMERDDGSSR